MSGSVNPLCGEPPTGEPYAGEPHVRFGGRGDRVVNRSFLPLSMAIEKGLRIARDCGFGIFHIDLLLLRAQVALYEGNPAGAMRDVLVALDEGVHPSEESGLPKLLAATDKECGYAWGIGDARHVLAEALLLQAAQTLGSKTYKPRSRKIPAEVRELIKSARTELQKCARLRKRIQDPRQEATKRVIDQLKKGVLTEYPLAPILIPTEEQEGDEHSEPSAARDFEKRFDVALSFPGEKREYVADVAEELGKTLGRKRVFYDKDYEAELARTDLDTYLQTIYHDQSELIAVFLCKEYETTEWGGLEWRASRDLSTKRQGADIMPFRFDGTHIPGLFSIDGYVSLKDKTPAQVAALIRKRLQINRGASG